MTTHNRFALGIEDKKLKVAAWFGLAVIFVAVGLVSDWNVVVFVAISNIIYFSCDILDINLHIIKVRFSFLKKNNFP